MDMHTVFGTIAERVPTASDPTNYVGMTGSCIADAAIQQRKPLFPTNRIK